MKQDKLAMKGNPKRRKGGKSEEQKIAPEYGPEGCRLLDFGGTGDCGYRVLGAMKPIQKGLKTYQECMVNEAKLVIKMGELLRGRVYERVIVSV